jgi:carbamoyltransferase
MNILGISAYYHDSAAAIIKDGEIIAAAQEERFTRKKNDKDFPKESIRFCLSEAKLAINDLDAVVFYDKSFLKFERLLETYYAFAPKGILSFFKSIPEWITEKIFIKRNIRKGLKSIQPFDKQKLTLLFSEHHLSHAASSFFVSGFQEAAILTIDGVGEWATTTICKGHGNQIEILKELRFPHSVGLLYSAFTYFLGFKVNSDEYKLMGLAPYGNPDSEETKRFAELIKTKLVKISEDGSIFLNQDYFSYAYGLRMINEKKFEKLFVVQRRRPDSEFLSQHLNLAYAIQMITEEIVFKLAKSALQQTGCTNLCMAGGVALNCVANGKLWEQKIFKNIFIQPAAGDAGGALGAALAAYHIYFNKPVNNNSHSDKMRGAYLGPSFNDAHIETIIKKYNPEFKKFSDYETVCKEVARLLSENNVIGWFQGKMEFGPRALGNRSILANAQNPEMQKILNLKIKFREGFRPFAPAVLVEDASDYFEIDMPSPFMLFVYPVKQSKRVNLPDNYNSLSLYEKLYCRRSYLQSVTHVDYTARVQTVSSEINPEFYQLLRTYKELTGCSVLINTSFNIKDEPIVCNPKEAFECFSNTAMDYLVLGNYLFSKKK